ncbi:MAG: hypothetical protein GF329_14270 [Candidatus Lokiarchaeota archaeon]|nr:hypothetical protein [Candidatus Lokiarchaeota archaeon]
MPFGEVLIQFWQNPGKILYGILVSITNFIGNLLNAIFEWAMRILGAFAEGAAQAIEAAIKAIILVLVFMMLAIELAMMLLCFGFIGILLGTILAFNQEVNFEWLNPFKIKITAPNSEFTIEYEIYWDYISILDLDIPISRFKILEGDVILSESQGGFLPGSGKSSLQSDIFEVESSEDKIPSKDGCTHLTIKQYDTSNSQIEIVDFSDDAATYDVIKDDETILEKEAIVGDAITINFDVDTKGIFTYEVILYDNNDGIIEEHCYEVEIVSNLEYYKNLNYPQSSLLLADSGPYSKENVKLVRYYRIVPIIYARKNIIKNVIKVGHRKYINIKYIPDNIKPYLKKVMSLRYKSE